MRKYKKQNKLTKYQIENYSINDLESYLENRQKINTETIRARVKELEEKNEELIQEIEKSYLFKLATLLLAQQANYEKIFILPFDEYLKREEKSRDKKLKNNWKNENQEWEKLFKNKKKYIDVEKNKRRITYTVNNPALVLLTMFEIVNKAHDKQIYEEING